MKLYSQRDSKWASILLGYNKSQPYTIGNYGCLITSFGMYIDKTPDVVNQILKDNNGFVAGTGNFIWSKCTVLGLNQTYVSPEYTGPVTSQGITKMKELLDSGYPLICRIDFNPSTASEEMHFILVTRHDGDIFYANDPWTGTVINLDVYGGVSRAVIQFRAYDKKVTQEAVKDTIEVYTQVFEELVNKSTTTDEVAKKLGTSTNRDIILGEIEKLIKYEDIIRDKDKKITELQAQLSELQKKLEDQSELLNELSSTNENLTTTIGEQDIKIASLTQEVQNAITEIKKLKEKVLDPTTSWYEDIKRGIHKLIRG